MNRFFGEIDQGSGTAITAGRVLVRTDLLSGPFPLSGRALVVLLIAHSVLALAMRAVPGVAAAHAFATVLVGLLYAMTGRIERVACVAAYICGSEVLWRMAHAPIFWEFGKYGIGLLLAVALFRFERWRNNDMATIYLLLLLPSTVRTLISLPAADAQKEISFNLSGPLALMVCVVFFSNLQLTGAELRKLFVALMAPVFGIATLAMFSVLTAESIQFTGESNAVTSGGYGPNQVSGMLGLGAVAAFFALEYGRATKFVRVGLGLLLTLFVAQSAFTFSRGGLYAASGTIAAACLYLTRDVRMRRRLAVGLLVIPGLAAMILVWENAITGGALANRFSDTSLTHRADLSQQDFAVWAEYPVFGSGPGMAKSAHSNHLAAHTEFSRLLGEHGIFGLAAMLFLVAMALQQVRKASSWAAKAMSAALILWAILFMTNSAMRIAAPSFVFGLAFASLVPMKQGSYRLRNIVAMRPAWI